MARILDQESMTNAVDFGLVEVALKWLAGEDVWFLDAFTNNGWTKALPEGRLGFFENIEYTTEDPHKPKTIKLYMKKNTQTNKVWVDQYEYINCELPVVILKIWEVEIPETENTDGK